MDTELNIATAAYNLISVSTMWPAVIFAAKRNDNVIGRTRILVVSIITKNGLSHVGAPSGRKCAVDFFVEYLNEDISILNHIGRPIDMVSNKWLEDEIEYGTIPIKLTITIIVNTLHTVIDIPLRLIDIVRNICSIINCIKGVYILDFRCGIFHMFNWIINTRITFMITVTVTVDVIKL